MNPQARSHRHPNGLRLLRVLSVLTLGALAACSTSSPEALGLKRTAAGRSRAFTDFSKALVLDLADHASDKELQSAAAGRTERIQAIQTACTSIADELAAALRASGAFSEVRRSGSPDATTLVIAGSLWRYSGEEGFTRLWTRNRAGNAQVELRTELREGSDGTVLASLISENASSGVQAGPRGAESLATATERVVDHLVRAVSSLKHPPAR